MKPQEELEAALHQVSGASPAGTSACWLTGGRMYDASVGMADIARSEAATSNTVYPVGSLTKVMTSFLVCQLIAENRLLLDEPVRTHLPTFNAQGAGADQVTIRHLLSHSSGLLDLFEPYEDGAALLTRLAEYPLLAEPGHIFSYSNVGYGVLGHLVEVLTGQSWEDNVRQRLLAPLALSRTAFTPPDPSPALLATEYGEHPVTGDLVPGETWPRVGRGLAAAGSTLLSTVRDMTSIMTTCLTGRGSSLSNQALLPDEILREMLSVQSQMPGPSLLADGWGLGWAIFDHAPAKHVGHIGGSSAFVHADSSSGDLLVVLTNHSSGARAGQRLAQHLFEEPAVQPVPSQSPDRDPQWYAGSYTTPLLQFDVRSDGQALLIDNPFTGTAIELQHLQADTFYVDLGPIATEVTFLGDRNGEATHIHTGLRLVPRSVEVR